MPNLVDISNQIYADLGSPATPTSSGIQFWLTAHLGDLNNAIATRFCLVNAASGWVQPCMRQQEASIFMNLYLVYYYRLQMNNNLGATAYDWSEVTEGDSSVRRVSKNEIAKTFRGLMNDTQKLVNDQAAHYRFDKSLPQSIEAITDLHQYERVNSIGNQNPFTPEYGPTGCPPSGGGW